MVGVAVSQRGFRDEGLAWRGGAVLLASAILVGFFAHRQATAILDDWDGYWAERVAEIEVDLDEELDRRQEAGEEASDALAALWEQAGSAIDTDDVVAIRERAETSALALYDSAGGLVGLGTAITAGRCRRTSSEVRDGMRTVTCHSSATSTSRRWRRTAASPSRPTYCEPPFPRG